MLCQCVHWSSALHCMGCWIFSRLFRTAEAAAASEPLDEQESSEKQMCLSHNANYGWNIVKLAGTVELLFLCPCSLYLQDTVHLYAIHVYG